MTKKLFSLATVVALVCCFCATSAYARPGSDLKEPEVKSAAPAEKTQAQEKLKADVTKLVADAKAGKLKVPAQQFPQTQRNNLSTGAKIGIIAAIAGNNCRHRHPQPCDQRQRLNLPGDLCADVLAIVYKPSFPCANIRRGGGSVLRGSSPITMIEPTSFTREADITS